MVVAFSGMFWYVAPCSLVHTDRRFRRAYFLHHQYDELSYCSFITLIVEAVIFL